MEILDALNTNTVDIQFLVKFCKENRIKFKYQGSLDKIIFYTENNVPNRSNITYYANGLICEYYDMKWHISCFPLPNLSNYKHYDKNIEYNIFPIYEGTVVNIYYSKIFNKWCFGTKKSFDLYDQEWRGIKYSSILDKIPLGDLDMNYTYIYNFTDKNLHLFSANHIQFPQKEQWGDEETTIFNILGKCNTQEIECFGDVEVKIEDVFTQSKNALDMFFKNKQINFGYILRSVNSSILIESSLLKKINMMVYKPLVFKNKNKRQEEYKKNSNINYIIAKCYIHNYKFSEIMFPSFKEKFKLIKTTESKLIEYLIKKYSTREVPFKKNNNVPFEEIKIFEDFVIKHAIELNTLLFKNSRLRNIIQDYIFKNKDIEFIFNLLNEELH